MNAMDTRMAIESRIWNNTHSDYKSIANGKRTVMYFGEKGTTLCALSEMSVERLKKLDR
jgi:hypothetical protein